MSHAAVNAGFNVHFQTGQIYEENSKFIAHAAKRQAKLHIYRARIHLFMAESSTTRKLLSNTILN